jgi:hypothetical protein
MNLAKCGLCSDGYTLDKTTPLRGGKSVVLIDGKSIETLVLACECGERHAVTVSSQDGVHKAQYYHVSPLTQPGGEG